MAINYKVDVLAELKKKGYNTNKIRKEKLFGESTVQALRAKTSISFTNLDKLCELLNCQPGDILEYVPNSPEEK